MNKSLLLIINPIAGKATIKNKLTDIIDLFIKNNYDVSVHLTQSGNDAYQTMKAKHHLFDLVVCSGGDGTLNEVLRALMDTKSQQAFGYIPCGTVNDFASTLNLSKQPLKCAKQIINGTIHPCDIGKMNGLYFSYIAAFGVFSDVSYMTPQVSKNILGHNAYLLEGMKQFINFKKYQIRIEYDGNVIEDAFCYGMITNTMSVGGIHFFQEKDIDLSDGYFECMFVKYPNNPIDYQQTIQILLSKDLKNSPRTYLFKAKKIKIIAQKEIAWTIDGEYGGDHQECTITNIHKAIHIIK